MSKQKLDNLSDMARDLFYFIQSSGNKLKIRDFVKIWMVEDRIQDLNSVTCGIFQIYFYDNWFNSDQNCKIQNKTKLNEKTTEALLKELFILDDQEQNDTTNTNTLNTVTSQSHDVPVPEPTITYLLGIGDFRQAKQYDKSRK